jgi:hypothetical protein
MGSRKGAANTGAQRRRSFQQSCQINDDFLDPSVDEDISTNNYQGCEANKADEKKIKLHYQAR